MRRSNFSGVILLSTLRGGGALRAQRLAQRNASRRLALHVAAAAYPFTLRRSRSKSSAGPARVQGLAARTISAPASPAGSGVRSTMPSPLDELLRRLPRLPPPPPPPPPLPDCRGGREKLSRHLARTGWRLAARTSRGGAASERDRQSRSSAGGLAERDSASLRGGTEKQAVKPAGERRARRSAYRSSGVTNSLSLLPSSSSEPECSSSAGTAVQRCAEHTSCQHRRAG